MWPFSKFRKLEEEIESLKRQITSLESTIQQKDVVQKTTEDKLEVAEKDKKALKKQFDFLKDVEVTPEFLEVEKAIKRRDPFIFVHGGAGTGKSTLIQWLKCKGLINVVLAPTGLTALNVGGMTIHRAFGLKPLSVFTKDGKPKSIPKDFLNVLHNLKEKNIATICIDEVSMVRSDLLDAINSCLENDFHVKPFGGFQVVFVGDLFQLPPIVPNVVEHFFDPKNANYPGDLHAWKSRWFLDSEVLSPYQKQIKRIDLRKVFRQAGEIEFVNTLNQLRKYQNLSQNATFLNQKLPVKTSSNQGSVIIVGTNQLANQYNDQHLQMLQTASRRYQATKTGVFLEYSVNNLPVPDDFILKIGEFIIIVANDKDKRYVNGTTGYITRFGGNGEVYVKNASGEFDVQINDWIQYDVMWDNHLKRFVNVEAGRYSQMPIIPGYAITCHKSQGKTIDSVYIDIQNVFAAGQMYVALSRTRSPKDITMARSLTNADFKTDPRLSEFKTQGLI